MYIIHVLDTPPLSRHSSAAGISRSVTITTLYVMCVSSLGMEESLAVVRFCRDIANPNTGFRMQLKKFAREQLEKVSDYSTRWKFVLN